MFTAIDCQGFAGGFTLGMQQAGFDIIAKRENKGGFGIPIVADNMPIPDIQEGSPTEWVARSADVVFGNPPCSGFSAFTQVSNRTDWKVKMGMGADINSCMWDLVRYASRCSPQMVIMESVQLAYTQGRVLMQQLRAEMESLTGWHYDLIHVLHNAASVGGASQRKRYFMVLAGPELEFGIEPPTFDLDSCPLFPSILNDLAGLEFTFDPQPYQAEPLSKYAADLRNPSGVVDGHMLRTTTETFGLKWISENGEWKGGEHVGAAMRRAIDNVGIENVPARLKYKDEGRLHQVTNMFMSTHAYSPRKAHAHKMAPVMTGTGAEDCIHPTEPRTLTYREVARVMGFPDTWSLRTIETAKGGPSQNQKWMGKGISVPCGKWIGEWAKLALEGNPGTWRGDEIGENEWLIDITNDYKAVYNDRSGKPEDARSVKLRLAMDARKREARVL